MTHNTPEFVDKREPLDKSYIIKDMDLPNFLRNYELGVRYGLADDGKIVVTAGQGILDAHITQPTQTL